MWSVFQDLRFAVRLLRKTPGFTLIVVITLALAIGANTAVFSVMNAVLFELLPVQRPVGLSYVRMANDQGTARIPAAATLPSLKQHLRSFASAVMFSRS